ncbi:hypothetical protein COU57_01615 [Candidatus Pacearchaeota archaeon CG10_big_fil_rev_8_21_14_0_10_32_14]|nr:MAG: hypothetical protein COU57_01615 [Candidatus Pacearchaeota archaeon CG10_big_fil_rev_8_21_14_0_10_32_14]
MKEKVLVAMSGGVDSSVAALIMKQKGYEVIGVFMKCFSDTKDPLTGECNWRSERRMAIQIASLLDIPLHTEDYEKEYKKLVIKEMINSYKKGITPNPDVDCNNKIKFPLLWKAAKKYKCNYLVTGHYVRILKSKNKNKSSKFVNSVLPRVGGEGGRVDDEQFRDKGVSIGKVGEIARWDNELASDRKNQTFQLHRAKAENKDQSYFLYRLTQNDLSHTIFPIGEFSKDEVREIARKNNFPNADKKGTSGICFIGKINVKEYLKNKIKQKKGDILDPSGKKIGEHDGIYFYTVGERIGPRHGINFEKQEPNKQLVRRWYVARKDTVKNILIVAPQDHPLLYRKIILVKELHLINPKEKLPKQIDVRIRHVGELLDAEFNGLSKSDFTNSNTSLGMVGGGGGGLSKVAENNKIKITLKTPITGISEGQAIVFYKKNSSLVLGGGVISFQ